MARSLMRRSASLVGSPRCQVCSAMPPTPIGFCSLCSGPATKPSREMDKCAVMRGIPYRLQPGRRLIGRQVAGYRGAVPRPACFPCQRVTTAARSTASADSLISGTRYLLTASTVGWPNTFTIRPGSRHRPAEGAFDVVGHRLPIESAWLVPIAGPVAENFLKCDVHLRVRFTGAQSLIERDLVDRILEGFHQAVLARILLMPLERIPRKTVVPVLPPENHVRVFVDERGRTVRRPGLRQAVAGSDVDSCGVVHRLALGLVGREVESGARGRLSSRTRPLQIPATAVLLDAAGSCCRTSGSPRSARCRTETGRRAPSSRAGRRPSRTSRSSRATPCAPS